MSDHNSVNSSCNVKIPWPGQSDKTMSCLSLASACHNSSLLASKFTPAGTAAQPLIETVTLTPDCCNCNTTGC